MIAYWDSSMISCLFSGIHESRIHESMRAYWEHTGIHESRRPKNSLIHACYQYCIQNIAVAHIHKKMSKQGVELKSCNSAQYLV